MSERLNVKNLILEPESPKSLNVESLRQELEPFLLETFKEHWHFNAEQMKQAQANLKPEVILPQDIDYAAKKAENDPAKVGEYTLNPDTATINWETIDPAKFRIEDLHTMPRGKSLAEVAKYILNTYGDKYHLPGLEYWQYALKHPDKMPPGMKEDTPKGQAGNAYFTFGSLVPRQDGRWRVPCARWSHNGWDRDTSGLGNSWADIFRVVLLEKTAVPKNFQPDSTPPQPKSRNF